MWADSLCLCLGYYHKNMMNYLLEQLERCFGSFSTTASPPGSRSLLVYDMPDARPTKPPELVPRRHNTAEREIASLSTFHLPADLLDASIRRLRVISLLYSAVFFLAAIFPNLVCNLLARFDPSALCREAYFTSLSLMGPSVLSILAGLAVFWFMKSDRPSATTKLHVGLAFQVLGSFGIALAEYQGVIAPMKYVGMENIADAGRFGLSWVSAWVLMFTVVVPSPPGRALLAAALSVSSVPIAFAAYSALGINTVNLGPTEFFFALVFPYILIVGMAWVSARVVYRLGTEVRRARELGSYRLVERLGEGGMGEVWRGEHRLLARPAAVKLIKPEVLGAADGEHRRVTLQRFEREAQATAALCSPHTVDLYDFGVSDDGAFYAVIELLDGFDLDTLVRKYGPLPAERVVHLLRQVCDSLAEAHDTGLIHRDVKPANIFTCRFGRATDWIKVLDFGMVKLPDGKGDSMLTGENMAGGTPAFMAPEQAVSGPVDGRSDLYSLGCVAYWLLTGEPVFSGHTPIETIVQHVKSAPTPPSAHSEVPVPPALDSIVLSCLAKSPDDRPQTADALARLLEAVELDREWDSERSREWWDLHLPHEIEANVRESNDLLDPA